jgi:Helix-turn-helix domain
MIMCDIHSLLEHFYSDGFTVESLSNATNISVELINRCYNGENLTIEDIHTLDYLLNFLTQLYLCDTEDNSYFKNIVTVICNYFMIPIGTIAKYLNLSVEQLHIFLDNPEHYANGNTLSIKLMHLYMTLIRDKKHSI